MQIGYVAVMARLLEPAAFGLVAMAHVVLRFGSYFAQMGMGQALIQKTELTKENIRAAFTSSVVLGFIFFVIIYFLAPLSIYIFNDIKVIPIVRIMALSFVLTGLSTTALSLLRRGFRFKELAIVEIGSYIIGYIGVGIISAILGFGVWSLVFAALSQAFIMAIISYLIVRHSLKLLFKWKHHKALFSFGSKVSIISFFEFIQANIDTIFIGKFFTASALGFYNRGYRLINLPLQFLTSSSSRVIYPAFSKIQNDKVKLRQNYLKAIMLLAQVLFPLVAVATVGANVIILTVLGPKWQASIPILRILAIPSALILIAHIAAVLLEAIAELKIKLKITLFNIILISILLLVLKNYNIAGVALSVGVGYTFVFFAYTIKIMRVLSIPKKDLIKVFIPGAVTAVILGISIFIFGFLTDSLNISVYINFIIIVVFSILAFIGIAILGPFKRLKSEINDLIILIFNKKYYLTNMISDALCDVRTNQQIAIKIKNNKKV